MCKIGIYDPSHCLYQAPAISQAECQALNPHSQLARWIVFIPIFHLRKLRPKVTLLISGRAGILTQHNLAQYDQNAHLFIKVPLFRFPDAIFKIALNLINRILKFLISIYLYIQSDFNIVNITYYLSSSNTDPHLPPDDNVLGRS